MHCGARVVASDALKEHFVPLARHTVVGTYDGVVHLFRAIGTGIGRARVARIWNPVQVVIRGCGYEGTIVRHDNIVPIAFPTEDVSETIIVDV